ncbi:MAG: zinc-binding dehydrogenase [Chthonomonadales bacterium]|nr:zinc-binding dehydrogenase [Chthonomonadales bacterium]
MHQAVEFTSRGVAALVEIDEPPIPRGTQVVLRTEFTGVTNGTERHALMSEHGYGGGVFPSRHGYQHVGIVESIGEAVQTLAVGDRIFCGDYVGHRSWHITDENGLIVKLPDDVDAQQCALMGVAGVALRAVRRMRVGAGDSVWVAGQGPIGHFIAQAARAVGARVTVTDLNARRLAAAREAGAHLALDPSDPDTMAVLKANGPFNFIFDGCSAPRLLFDIFENGLLAHTGCIGMMAVRSEVTYPWSILHGTEARIETSCHFSRDDLRVLLFLIRQGLIRMEPIISDILPIAEAPALYGRLAAGDPALMGVVFDWR